MTLIPALLPLLKPQIHSIDRKGRATIAIRLLSVEWMDQPKAFTVTKCYRSWNEDLLIMVKKKKKDSNVFRMDHIVGPAKDLATWNTILPHRIHLPSQKHLMLHPFTSLPEAVTSSPMETAGRQFLLVDSPGAVDREDGIWFDSNTDFGVFVVDIPAQLGWTHNRKPCSQILLEQWTNQTNSVGIPPTRTFYLPTERRSMLDPASYHCITPETLRQHTMIPILCFHWNRRTVFRSCLYVSHSVTFLHSDQPIEAYPSWFRNCPSLRDTSVADWNITMNTHWFPSSAATSIVSHSHPLDSKQMYAPITSPVRSLCDLWNQCVAHDILSDQTPFSHDAIRPTTELDLQKSKFLRFHSSVLSLTKQLFETHSNTDELPMFEGCVSTVIPHKGIFVTLHISQSPVIFLPFHRYPDILSVRTGDPLFLRCQLQRNPDPFQKIQWSIEDIKTESEESTPLP